MLGLVVSGGVVNGKGGVSVALVVAASCKGFLQGVGLVGLQYVVDDLVANEVPLAGSAQGVLEEGSGHQWAPSL